MKAIANILICVDDIGCTVHSLQLVILKLHYKSFIISDKFPLARKLIVVVYIYLPSEIWYREPAVFLLIFSTF